MSKQRHQWTLILRRCNESYIAIRVYKKTTVEIAIEISGGSNQVSNLLPAPLTHRFRRVVVSLASEKDATHHVIIDNRSSLGGLFVAKRDSWDRLWLCREQFARFLPGLMPDGEGVRFIRVTMPAAKRKRKHRRKGFTT